MKFAIAIGLLALISVTGVGLYVSDFTAYLGDNPSTCNNCHIMDSAYEGWYHAGHKNWAKCNDCHTPHTLIPKYWVKAQSGYHHVTTFFFGDIPSAIRAKPSSKEVVQENCIRCHQETVAEILSQEMYGEGEVERYCFECHRSAAHGERGVSVLPYQHQEEGK